MSFVICDEACENFVTLRSPQYGYSTVIHMGLHYSKVYNQYKIWDDTSPYDWRVCRIPSFLLTSAEQAALSSFFNDITLGRGNQFYVSVYGDSYPSPSGVYPFGADLGDVGTWLCKLVSHKRGGVQYDPKLWFGNSLDIQYVSTSSDGGYVVPSAEDEGDLLIGGCSLRYPQVPPKPTQIQHLKCQRSRGGVITSIDLGKGATDLYDNYESELELLMRTGNTAAMITYLTGTARGTAFEVNYPENSYLFGIDIGSSGDVACQLLNNELEIKHVGFDRFSLNLKLNYYGGID